MKSNKPDREFKLMIIMTLTGHEKRMEDLRNTLNKEIENKTKQKGPTKK